MTYTDGAVGADTSNAPDFSGAASPGFAVQTSSMRREVGDIPESRRAKVKTIQSDIKRGRRRWADDFAQMRDDMKFAAGKQWPNQTRNDDRYVVNITLQHVKSRTSSLYAKNPQVVAKRRKRLEFAVWDGSASSLQVAQATMAMYAHHGIQPPPEVVSLMQDVSRGIQNRQMLDAIARTLVLLWDYFADSQIPNFKRQMKQLVRRVITCGVGYVRPGFQRIMEKRPETASEIADLTDRIAHIESLAADLKDGEFDEYSAKAEELRTALAALESEPEVIVREGLTHDFPAATRIIPDPRCTQLNGFIGCEWVAEEFEMTVDEIKDVYGVDVGTSYTSYKPSVGGDGPTECEGGDKKSTVAMVYHYYEKNTGLRWDVCEGYPDALTEPAPPEIKIDQFWPWFVLSFNDLESEEQIFPPSDVSLMRHPQREYNRTRQALRHHRRANRPLYVAPAGALEEEDENSLADHDEHDVIMLSNLKEGQKAEDLLQPLKKAPIDPNVYESESVFKDVIRSVGSQQADMGATGGADTATEASIAENSKLSTTASCIDDIDELLSALARAGGQILLAEMSPETVTRIVGPGAVWPVLTTSQVAEMLYLDIRAGSSGKPNKAQTLANIERVAPFAMQTPGISPEWFATTIVGALDDTVDLTDAVIAGIPSMVAMNAQKQLATGNAATDPAMQGPQGADRAPNPAQRPGGPQPGFPAPAPGAQPAAGPA